MASDTTVLVWKSFSNGKVFGMLDRKTTSVKSSLRPESGSFHPNFPQQKMLSDTFGNV